MSRKTVEAIRVEAGCEGEGLAREALGAAGVTSGAGGGRLGGRRGPPRGVLLRRHKGRFLKPCPGTRRYICCGYYVLNLVMGCPLRCTYCVLQDYLGDQEILVAVNWEDALQEVRGFLADREGIVRVGTGELADSLALEPWIGLSRRLVPFFRDLPGAILELKTKTAQVEALLDLSHGGRTVVSWSLNPPSIIDLAEPGTSPLERRLAAARRCQEAGYPIGLHFDPMVMVAGWEEEYRALVEAVFRTLDARGVLWISLGALRYPPSLHERLLPSGLALGELFPGLDGKMRYLRPLRARMFREMAQWIREMGGPDPLVYLCMENPEVWKEALGWAPRDAAALDRRFQARIEAYWGRTA